MKFRAGKASAVSLAAYLAIVSVAIASVQPKHGQLSPKESALVFERFSHVHVPADANAVSRALGDSAWISRSSINRINFIAGFVPIEHNLFPPGGIFVVELTKPTSLHNSGYHIYLHTTADFPGEHRHSLMDNFGVITLRGFLAGQSASNVKIDEYALCYSDGRILHVLPHSRRMMPSRY